MDASDATHHHALGEEALPELNVFFIGGGRHDKDRIELQFGFDGLVQGSQRHFNYDVDFVLFVPKSLGLTESESIDQLRQEFQSYVRLHTHVTDPKSETSLSRVRERLEQMKERLDEDAVRVFAIEFEGFLKGQNRKLRKEFYKLPENPSLLQQIPGEIEAIHTLIGDFRAVLARKGLVSKTADELPRGSVERELLLLNEYVSHVYVQHLGELHTASHRVADAKPVVDLLEKHTREEYQVRDVYDLMVDRHHTATAHHEEDLYLNRISLLKKYFQKALFLEVAGETRQKRLLIPVYAMSAALAASWAIMVQLYQAQTLGQRLGINSIALIAVAVVTYVCKDIMKDFFRRFFFSRSSRWFPDYDRTLYSLRRGRRARLGVIREFIRTFDSEKLAADLKAVRYHDRGGDMEEALREDVLHFKKQVTLDLNLLDNKREFPWGVREVVRYRFDRLYPSMEDAFKHLHVVSKTGLAGTRHCHRIYHIYLATWIQASSNGHTQVGPPVKPAFKAFRVTLDKMGVLACQTIDWRRGGLIPSPPT